MPFCGRRPRSDNPASTLPATRETGDERLHGFLTESISQGSEAPRSFDGANEHPRVVHDENLQGFVHRARRAISAIAGFTGGGSRKISPAEPSCRKTGMAPAAERPHTCSLTMTGGVAGVGPCARFLSFGLNRATKRADKKARGPVGPLLFGANVSGIGCVCERGPPPPGARVLVFTFFFLNRPPNAPMKPHAQS
jgi:hypothetical protein